MSSAFSIPIEGHAFGKAEAEERSINDFESLWLSGNNALVSALGTAHLDLRLAIRGLSFADRGWGRVFMHNQFSNPVSRSA
jgi:hypothetical protein